MAEKVLNIKVRSPFKLRNGLTGNYHATCHYSYNLPLGASVKDDRAKDRQATKIQAILSARLKH